MSKKKNNQDQQCPIRQSTNINNIEEEEKSRSTLLKKTKNRDQECRKRKKKEPNKKYPLIRASKKRKFNLYFRKDMC